MINHRLIGSILAVILPLILFSHAAWTDNYYKAPKTCTGLEKEKDQQPENPYRFISSKIHDQGNTPSCGFHTGTVLLEALVNSQSPHSVQDSEKKALSVPHCMDQLGVYT